MPDSQKVTVRFMFYDCIGFKGTVDIDDVPVPRVNEKVDVPFNGTFVGRVTEVSWGYLCGNGDTTIASVDVMEL